MPDTVSYPREEDSETGSISKSEVDARLDRFTLFPPIQIFEEALGRADESLPPQASWYRFRDCNSAKDFDPLRVSAAILKL